MRKTCLDMVYTLAKQDPRVVFVGSDLGPGVLDEMKFEMPDRFFMEGVSEQAIIGIAAGLAMEGYIPYVNTIATFITRRCYEQVAVDLCLHDLPVRLIANGGGLVYAPLGPTHLATEDVAIMRALPNMAVVSPADATEMQRFMSASLDWPHPIYIRLGKGGDPVITGDETGFEIGRAICLRSTPAGGVTFLTSGVMSGRALDAAEQLANSNIQCGVLHLPTIKPLDHAAILQAVSSSSLVVTIEEHTLIGGLGSAVGELFIDQRVAVPLLRLGLPDAFPQGYGSQESMLAAYGLEPPSIAEAVARALATDMPRPAKSGMAS